MRKLITLIMAVLFAVPIWAKEYDTVCVNLVDGTQVKIQMSGKLELSFDDENLIAVGDDADVTVSKANILNFTHSFEGQSGVDGIESESEVSFDGANMQFNDLPSGSVVTVYDLSGKILLNAQVEGSFELSLSQFGNGVFVVKVNKESYKVNVK